ncbi:ribosomal protein S18-alanine N-acetyltransferase [Asticcacaulis sp. EMRT-3]|uniref:ribosomal protein S18-alanine N-acetyltransferase n=1 Tax=Asticcacaulis sp. EMRT-3 TaxID=3040349 RepID=UPI0024AFFAD4|nr:ribosomal protein S18-alanine N-acetyltransferase [Asticcacaulis sp. EMRT-3]MDI7775867.1 ribosomal protein S18-alanine N-acetyltransferase [Asticcacaulis sp. EMRT-3]
MTTIRQLTAPSQQLALIHTRCFDFGWSEEVFADLLIKPHHRTYVFESDGEIVSFVVMAVVVGEGEILTIATDPAFQRKGLARLLLQQVIGRLQKEGADSLFLEVATDNDAAIRLYESCGFKRTGRRKAYYSRRNGAPVDAHILRLALQDGTA